MAADLGRVKAKLQAIKEKIDETEDRELEAKEQLREAEERLEKAEGEREGFKRRLVLCKTDAVRVAEQLEVKTAELAHVLARTKEEEQKCKSLEVGDREMDDKLRELEDVLVETVEYETSTAEKLAEVELKMKVVQAEVLKSQERGERFEMIAEQLMNQFTGAEENMRDLEVKDAAASEREIDSEDKIEFINENLKQMVVRYEEAERKAPPLEYLLDTMIEDLELTKLKRRQIDEEMKAMGELVDEVTIDTKPKAAAIFEQMDQTQSKAEEEEEEEE